jgi:hypothetical protein
MVIEKREDTYINGVVTPANPPQYGNLLTVVEADNSQEAVHAVIAATGRIGSYFVVEGDFFRFDLSEQEVTEGVIRAKKSGSLALQKENGEN